MTVDLNVLDHPGSILSAISLPLRLKLPRSPGMSISDADRLKSSMVLIFLGSRIVHYDPLIQTAK